MRSWESDRGQSSGAGEGTRYGGGWTPAVPVGGSVVARQRVPHLVSGIELEVERVAGSGYGRILRAAGMT